MKILLTIIAALLLSMYVSEAKSLDEYVNEAQSHFDAKNFERAISTMETAMKEHPDNSVAYAKLGYYISETAKGYVDLFSVLPKAFAMWDTAIALNPDNVDARFNRGTWGTYVPQSMGQLSKAILDLEYMVEVLQHSSDPDTQAQLVETYSFLADGYRKSWEFQKAKATYGKVIELAPDTRTAKRAQNYIDITDHFEKWMQEREQQKVPDSPEIIALKEKAQKNPNDVDLLLILGNTYLEANKDEEAAEIFERAVAADTMNLKAYKMLVFAITRILDKGYDPKISMDHNVMADLMYKKMHVMDKAVSITPDDLEMRLMRGSAGVEASLFWGRLDQGMEDLQMILESDASDVMRATARYELGKAHQRKAHSHWLKVISEYPDEQAVDSVFDELNPGLKQIDISEYKTPVVVVDFVLGFKDGSPPQTAVWVEDKDSRFVKTIYVSGFSGYARSMGRIPQWTASSQFTDVDAVTGASIDLGHHIYVWDLKDPSGKKVKSGDYVVKVETAYWPSMQYQIVDVPITLGKKADHVVIKEGNLIPYMEVRYLP